MAEQKVKKFKVKDAIRDEQAYERCMRGLRWAQYRAAHALKDAMTEIADEKYDLALSNIASAKRIAEDAKSIREAYDNVGDDWIDGFENLELNCQFYWSEEEPPTDED